MDIPSYQSGYADAKSGKASQYPAQPPVPPASDRVIVKPTDDFAAILKSIKAYTKFQFVANASYTLKTPLTAPFGYSLDANNAAVGFIPAAGTSSLFRIEQPNTEVFNLNAVAANPAVGGCNLFRVYAPMFTFRNSSVSAGFGTVMHTDVGGTYALFQDLAIGLTNSCTGYFTADNGVARRVKMKGSVGETTFRVDMAADNTRPNGVIVDDCDIWTVGGNNGKGCMEWREAGVDCWVEHSRLYDYIRVGQDNAKSAGFDVQGITVRGNQWPKLPPTIQQHLMLKGGIVATITDNDFLVNATMQVASVDGPSTVTFANNRRHANAAGVVPRAHIYNPVNTPASAVVTDDDTPYVPFGS